MKTYIRDALYKWMYLGYDRETIQQHRAETDLANLRTLKRVCLLAMGIVLVMGVHFGATVRDATRYLITIGLDLCILLLYVYVHKLIKTGAAEPIRGTNTLICIASIISYLVGIASGTVMANGELGVLAVWMFLLLQSSFDIPPLQNALTVIPSAALFLIASRLTKPVEQWRFDLIYTVISVLVGLFVSHHQTRLAIDNIIAKSCLTRANFALYHTCTTDELTGLSNRRMVFNTYDDILSECVQNNQSMACVVLDIDDYKQYNDAYGHPEGDELLRRIGEILCHYGAEQSVDIGRIGGEEFMAVWAEDSVLRCEHVAEELRRAVERMDIAHKGAVEHERVTMSVGVCLLPAEKAQNAYYYADKALYRAKEAGKNCSCRYDAEEDSYRFVN